MGIFGASIKEFLEDDAPTLAAAISFYISTSLAPLLLVLVSIISFLNISSLNQIISQINQVAGPQVGSILSNILESTSKSSGGIIALVIGTIITFVSASTVIVQLNYSFNRIWKVKEKEGLFRLVRKRMSLIATMLIFAILVIGSLVLSSYFTYSSTSVTSIVLDQIISIIVFSFLFAFLYKFVPDRKIETRSVWAGAVLASVLFTAGKFGISYYLSHSAISSSYGIIGSFIALLLWVYYSTIIVLFGAEMSKAYSEA